MKIPTLRNLPKKKLAITSSVVMGAILTPFVTYACYQNIVKPEKPKSTVAQEQKVEEKKTEAPQAAAEAAVAPAPVAVPAPKPVATAKPAAPKPTSTVTKTETKPTYQVVSVGVSKSGGSIVASIGSTKAGTCYFVFKQYDADGNKLAYKDVNSAATNGSCSAAIPVGTWTKVYVTYKAGDYTVKGYGELAL